MRYFFRCKITAFFADFNCCAAVFFQFCAESQALFPFYCPPVRLLASPHFQMFCSSAIFDFSTFPGLFCRFVRRSVQMSEAASAHLSGATFATFPGIFRCARGKCGINENRCPRDHCGLLGAPVYFPNVFLDRSARLCLILPAATGR